MSGLKLVIPNFVSTNPNLPILREDKRLTAGSLLLIDFSHPLMNSNTIPVNGSTIKNIAYQEAMLLLTANEANVSPSIINTITPTGGLMEFTAKKGLHGIISQTADVQSGNDFKIGVPSAIKTYVFNNLSRGIFISVWSHSTRISTAPQNDLDLTVFFNNTSNYIEMLKPSGFARPANFRLSKANETGNRIANCKLQPNAQGSPVVSNSFEFVFGSFSGLSSANTSGSKILYQLHIVDLTSAGLTYAQADALDLANYTQAFGVGGRFENDTFTSPSTLL